MRCSTRARDDDLDPATLRTICVFEQLSRCAVRTDDALLKGDVECIKRFARVAHRLPIAARSHDDPDKRSLHWHD